jgi:hypothetical protein
VDVDVFGVDGEPVPGRVELHGVPDVTQPAAEPGHLGLEGVGGAGRGIVAVQAVDQSFGGDQLPGVQQEEREE